jgi:Ca2+-binding RTX toxin-like protein
MSFAIFNESFYLTSYPDIRDAVARGIVGSGLEHFQRFGLQEGRFLISPLWNEAEYLRVNLDIAAVIPRVVPSGAAHFVLFGETEGRRGAPVVVREAGFNENYYLSENPDIAAAFARGQVSSGKSHFVRFGQLENRTAVFSGTVGDDVVSGTGVFSGVIGVAIDIIANRNAPDFRPISVGRGEVDLLTGGGGSDTFIIGSARTAANAVAIPFYVGGGDSDYAYIKSFVRGVDFIQLAGRPNEYNIATGGTVVVGGVTVPAVSILTAAGDRVAVVENVTELRLNTDDPSQNIFFLG